MTTTNAPLPYAIQRSIRKFAPALRDAITRAITAKQESLGRSLKPEEIGECASEVIFGIGEYDRGMEALCIEAFDAERYTPLSQVMDELRARIPATGPAQVQDC